jgi:ATP-dependent helicase HrpA/adenine-specific DNA-methyltransferase
MPRVLKEYARSMRITATSSEILIWQMLRNRKLNAKFRRQHPVGRYILDFYCASEKLAIELDGSQHFDPAAIAYDEQRNTFFRSKGILILRYNNNDVLQKTMDVIEDIWNVLHSKRIT